jgi:outer membrane protein
MRNFLLAFWVATTFLMSGAVAQAEEVKFGVVDADQVLNSIEEGKAAKDELMRKQKEAEDTLREMYEEFAKDKEAFEKRVESHAVKDEVLQLEQLDLMEKQAEIQNKAKALEAKVKMTYERLVAPLSKEIFELIQKVGKEDGYTMVFQRDSAGLLYTRESIDITDEVIKRFNRKE